MEPIHKEMLLASLQTHNMCEITVGGTSMWPFIRHGDTLIIKYKPFKPGLGTVVGFFAGDQLIVHRIIWYRRKGPELWDIYVHGDASPFSIAKIDTEAVIGVVQSIKRRNKKITLWFTFPVRIGIIPFGFFLQCLVALRLFTKQFVHK